MRARPSRPGVLIIVQNLPVPLDRRVWLECQSLAEAGYHVSVICQKAPGDPKHQTIGTIDLYKYRPYPPTKNKRDLAGECLYAFATTAWLSVKARRHHRVDVIQACNPADIFWPIALAHRLVGRTRFVFDQHDLCPELFISRFPDGSRLLYWGLRGLERCTYLAAQHVIATNGSYRAIATGRGKKRADDVTIVRTGPDADRLRRQEPDHALRRGRRFLVAYLGVMGPQDGVDLVLRAAHSLVYDLGRRDVSFLLMGTGDCFDDLVALREALKVEDYVEFTGRVPDDVVFRALSTADAGLSADPKNPLNDVSTMNKTMEYMAFGLPVVAFDLKETRISAQGAAVYAEPNDIAQYAQAISDLLDDEPARRAMGAAGRSRIEHELAWQHQRAAYVGVFDRLVPQPQRDAG